MKALLLLIGLAWAWAVPSARAQWRLFYQSQDLFRRAVPSVPSDNADPIVLIEPRGELSKYLIVRYAHSKRALVLKKSVWGFSDSTNVIWRVYRNDLCRVTKYNDTWVEYGLYRSRSTRGGLSIWYEPGFSRGLDGKIWSRWSEAMADAPPGHIVP
ncbi:hypothetical protein [Spirosoma rhododendri]|uniref:Uncharacterized protein n=1 Tax=Spirosoma rhododendri TaxID=2728024 RepID=A0A7L5DXH7_9BACT|nr:hypothetical protein [Spirosoma rhododendri]QJD80677.1 hypothetical protein HH216_21345 [Spirosoma rhododendri]